MSQDALLAFNIRPFQTKRQRRRIQGQPVGFGREAQVPGLVGHPLIRLLPFCIGQEEAEVVHVIVQPFAQIGKPAARLVLPGFQREPGAGGQAVRIVDVEIRAPVMAAGAGQGAPVQDGVQSLGLAQLQGIEGLVVRIQQRALPAPLAVPDGELALEAY